MGWIIKVFKAMFPTPEKALEKDRQTDRVIDRATRILAEKEQLRRAASLYESRRKGV